jgi:Co/Zn/Cd efflux system component
MTGEAGSFSCPGLVRMAALSLALLAGVGLHELFGWWWADPVGALAMLPVILWQGWETLGEAREHEDEDSQ